MSQRDPIPVPPETREASDGVESAPRSPRPVQFTMGTMLLVAVAIAPALALAREIFVDLRAPIVFGPAAHYMGIILPVLWIGAWRRERVNGLLIRFAVGAGYALVFSGMEHYLVKHKYAARPAPLLVLGIGWSSIFLLSIAWYAVAVADPGVAKERRRRFAGRFGAFVLQIFVQTYLINSFLGFVDLSRSNYFSFNRASLLSPLVDKPPER